MTQALFFFEKFMKELSQDRLSHITSRHKNLIFNSFIRTIKTFSPKNFEFEYDEMPIWIQLIHSKDGGLRQVSSEWFSCCENVLKIFNYPLGNILSEISDCFLAYRLGQFKLVRKILESKEEISLEEEALKLRMEISQGNLTKKLLDEVLLFPETDMLKASLIGSFLVQAHRKNFTFYPENLPGYLKKCVGDFSKTPENSNIPRGMHILNSLNYIYLNNKKYEKVNELLGFAEMYMIPAIKEEKLKKHIHGNLLFHHSLMAQINGNIDKQLSYLLQAAELDNGFSDFYYRIAQIYHDRKSMEAKNYYEEALVNSPMIFSIVNDYGCFLNDMKLWSELKSWECIAQLFYSEGK